VGGWRGGGGSLSGSVARLCFFLLPVGMDEGGCDPSGVASPPALEGSTARQSARQQAIASQQQRVPTAVVPPTAWPHTCSTRGAGVGPRRFVVEGGGRSPSRRVTSRPRAHVALRAAFGIGAAAAAAVSSTAAAAARIVGGGGAGGSPSGSAVDARPWWWRCARWAQPLRVSRDGARRASRRLTTLPPRPSRCVRSCAWGSGFRDGQARPHELRRGSWSGRTVVYGAVRWEANEGRLVRIHPLYDTGLVERPCCGDALKGRRESPCARARGKAPTVSTT